MLAILPPPRPEPDDTSVQLHVRIGNSRTVSYSLNEGEFLIGGANGCDLRLPSPGLPPVVCQFSRSADGLRVRKLSPTVPVLLNEKPLSGSTPVNVQNGDLVQVANAEIVVQQAEPTYTQPKLTIHEETPRTPPSLPDRRVYESVATPNWDGERAELEEQRRELEEERAIWYQRRMQWEAELKSQPNAQELHERELAVSARERELQSEFDRRFSAINEEMQRRRAEFEAELEARRQQAEREFEHRARVIEEEIAQRRLEFETDVREYEPRLVELHSVRERLSVANNDIEKRQSDLLALRDELQRERDAIEDERRWQLERLKELDQQLLDRDAEVARREQNLAAERAQLDEEKAKHKEDLLRLDRWEASLEQKHSLIDGRAAEVNERYGLLQRNSAEWEDTVRLADSEQARLRQEAERLERLRTELDEQAATIGERGAMLESQQAALAVLRTNLARQQDTIQHESAALAAERLRLDELRKQLDSRVHDTEYVRAELGTLRDSHEAEHRTTVERNSLLSSTIEEHRAAEAALRAKELEIDARTAEFAEQVALLKSRIQQVQELQERLERDREAVTAREQALSGTDESRLLFQEQLRKRAEELANRAKQIDEIQVKLAEERAVMERLRAGLDSEKSREEERLEQARRELAQQAKELEERVKTLSEQEATVTRQVSRLKEVGETVAAERKALFDARAQFENDKLSSKEAYELSQQEAEAMRSRVAAHFAELRSQAPDLDSQAKASLERLASSRENLRGHLDELHNYARKTREELDAARNQLRLEAEQQRQREQELEATRSEHRLAITGFRQQLLDWQSNLNQMKQAFANSEQRVEQRQTEVEEAIRKIAEARDELQRQSQEITTERKKVSEKRVEMERHLTDMREWYRRKLRELAAGRAVDESDMPQLKFDPSKLPSKQQAVAEVPEQPPPANEPDPGDQHLGELLKARGLVDENTLQALWGEARRQRKTLRQTLLASGALTLYQLALIEAGNLDGLMLGRLRVVDRLRATSKETAYRVFDPTRPGGPTRGIYVLRHLAESEMQDAVHPDEFRQRFSTLARSPHPNLANTLETLEILKRPAALQEWVMGLSSADWPPVAATPGVWLRLLTDAAKGIQHAHKNGLVHGRLAPDSFLLTSDGSLKILGFGEPAWLGSSTNTNEQPASADLRALGQVAFMWSQLGSRRRGIRTKPFPVELTNVIRRLEIGAESTMGDVVAIDRPYADAAELLRDLARLSESNPCPADGWEKLIRFAGENTPDQNQPLKASA